LFDIVKSVKSKAVLIAFLSRIYLIFVLTNYIYI